MALLLNPDASRLKTASAVYAGSARRHYVPPMTGSASLKCVLAGEAHWTVEGTTKSVQSDRTLLVGQGVRYSLAIEGRDPTRTCCVFFAPGFLESVRTSALGATESDGLLDVTSRYEAAAAQVGAVQVWKQLLAGDTLAAESALLDLGAVVVGLVEQQTCERFSLGVARPATRQDLHRRLSLARDFVLDSLDQNLTVETVSGAVAMAPFHFHRLFRSCFGMPVSRFVRLARLRQAARELASDTASISEIALRVGYESTTAFARAFHRHLGVSPSAFRSQFRKNGVFCAVDGSASSPHGSDY